MNDELQFKTQLLETHNKRLRALELQAARYGLAADPATLIEIEEIRGTISRLEQEISQPSKGNIVVENNQLYQKIDQLEQMLHQLQQSVNTNDKRNPSGDLPKNQAPNTKTIRKLLTQYFTDEDIRIFCYDNYRPVYDQFSATTSKNIMVQSLIEYCDRRNTISELYDLIVEERPNI